MSHGREQQAAVPGGRLKHTGEEGKQRIKGLCLGDLHGALRLLALLPTPLFCSAHSLDKGGNALMVR